MASNRNSNHFLVQGSILAAASLLVRVIGLIYRIPMQRIIGDEGMGLYAYSYEVYNIVLILSSYSLPLAVSKLVASRGINREHKNAYRIFLGAMVMAIVAGLSATVILYIGAEFFLSLFSNDIAATLSLRVLAPTIFVFSIMGVLRGFYQGKNTMIPTAISQLIEQVVNAVVSILAAYLLMKNYNTSANVAAYGAAGGTLGTLTGAFVGLLFLLFVFILYKPYINKQMQNDISDSKESYLDIVKLLILTILPIILSQTVYQISGIIDNSLFGHIMATKEVAYFDKDVIGDIIPGQLYSDVDRRTLFGIYSNKYRLLTNVPVAIATAIGAAIITSISAAKTRGMDGVIRRKTHAAIKFNMIIAIPSAVGMGVLASPILQLLFKDTNQLSANFLRLGSISIVFYAFSTVTTAVLQGVNRLKVPVINSAISLGIHILLVFMLLKYTSLSTYSLVIGNVTFALVVCILNWISIERYLDYRQEVMKTFAIPSISAVIMGFAVFFTYEGLMLWIGSNALATLICLIEAVILYFALLIFMKGVDEEELMNLPKGEAITRLIRRLHLL